jgi:hypothetical protein
MSRNTETNPLPVLVAAAFIGGIGLVIFVRMVTWLNSGIGASSILEALK